MGELLIPDKTGHAKLQWDKNNPEEVKAAREKFNAHRAKGGLVYRTDENGNKAEVIHTFDPDAQRIFMDPSRSVGG